MTLLYLILGLACFGALFALTELVARTERDPGNEKRAP
jgi:hypothetical protein